MSIVRTEDVLGGEPRLEGRRISVLQIAERVIDAGQSPEYIADQLDLSLSGRSITHSRITTTISKK